MKLFQWMQAPVVYIRISKNQFVLRHIQSQNEIILKSTETFTTRRLLVGEFVTAEQLLKSGLKRLFEGRLFSPSPILIMHPLDMVEGGLSPVEERVLKELAMGVGARTAHIQVGRELSDQQVLTRAGQDE